MQQVIAFANQKGGVGKTTTAFTLAHGLARAKKRVLVIDNDAQGSLGNLFLQGAKPTALTASLYQRRPDNPMMVAERIALYCGGDGLDAVATGEQGAPAFSQVLKAIGDRDLFDLVLIDCGPSLSTLSFAALMAAQHVLVPSQPTKLSLDGLGQLLARIRDLRVTGASQAAMLGIVITMHARTVYHREMESALRKARQDVLETVLFKRTAYEEAAALGKSLWDYEPQGQATLEAGQLTKEILKRLNGGAK